MDAAEVRALFVRGGPAYVTAPRERAEQAAARAVAHLASYLDEGRRKGERVELERAAKALEEALAAQLG